MKGRTVSSFFGEKMGIVKYEPKYKQQVQNVCISQSTSRYKDDNAKNRAEPFPPFIQDIIKKGGLLSSLK